MHHHALCLPLAMAALSLLLPVMHPTHRPPRNDTKGIAIALSIIAAWAVLFFHACWRVRLPGLPGTSAAGPQQQQSSHWLDVLLTFMALEFINTGLFITTRECRGT